MKLQDIIIWILFILSIVVALWYLFGNSPTFEQAIIVFILTVLFTISVKISDIKSEVKWLKSRFIKMEDSFIKLVDDFKVLKRGK
jgi:sensor histidine kinase YesM